MKIERAGLALAGRIFLAGTLAPIASLAQLALPPEAPVPAAPRAAAPPAAPPAAPSAAAIQFATPAYDFGKVAAGQLVKYDYVFTNTGIATLEVLDVRPSCGCTTAGTWQRRVEPGQTGTIPIQFNSANFSGPVHKSVTVTCNASNQAVTVLQLSGTVWKPIDVNPSYVYFNVTAGSQTNDVRVVKILNNQSNDVAITEVELTNRYFTAELKAIRPGKEYEVQVKTVPPLPTGSVQGSLNIKTSVTNFAPIHVTVFAVVQAPVVAMPSQLMLPGTIPTNGTRMGLTIRNNSATNLTVSEPVVNVPGVDIHMVEAQPGRVYNVILNFPAGFAIPAGQKAELTVKTSHPLHPVVKVPIVQMQRAYQPQPTGGPAGLASTNQVRPPFVTSPIVGYTNPARLGPLPQPVRTTNQMRSPPLPPAPSVQAAK